MDGTDILGYEDILDSLISDEFLDAGDEYDWPQSQADESFSVFSLNIIAQVLPNIAFAFALCIAWRICHMLYAHLPMARQRVGFASWILETILHLLSVAFGCVLLTYFFGDVCIKVCAFIFTIGILLTVSKLVSSFSSPTSVGEEIKTAKWSKHVIGVTLSCLALQMYGEFYMVPKEWHMIRGTVMILIMKAISVSACPPEAIAKCKTQFKMHVSMMNFLAWCGYAFSPGSVIFGPWFDFDDYLQFIRSPSPNRHSIFHDIPCACVSSMIAISCILYSTYIASISDTTNLTSFRWINAFLQSQSFRFSHYFVSFFSQSLHQAIGFSPTVGDKKQHDFIEAKVTNPVAIELPRSLVDVVVYWNLPMHVWLKQYIYKPTRRFGQLPALLLTYAFSSLLHGLNFQLAAVLFSIGVYAYIEFVLRDCLSLRWNACIGARVCRSTCKHINKANWWMRLVNFGFSVLAIFHLAYLAVMFDTGDQQDTGYNMFHVFDKWSNLHFLSHIVATATYMIYLLIR